MNQKTILTVLILVLLLAGGMLFYFDFQRNQAAPETTRESITNIAENRSEDEPTNKKHITDDWALFNDKQLGFSFKHPTDWEFSRLPQESYDAPPIELVSPNGSRLIISPEDSPFEHRSFTVNGYITRYSETIDGHEVTVEQLPRMYESDDQEVEAIVRIDSLEFLPDFMIKMYYGSKDDINIFHNLLNSLKFASHRPSIYRLELKESDNFKEVSLVYYDEQGNRRIIEDNIYALLSEIPKYGMRILVALPEAGKIILQEMHYEAGPQVTYSYDLNTQKMAPMKNTKYITGPYARLSPDGTKIANHGVREYKSLYVSDLISDTANEVVELTNTDETLIESCEFFCSISIAWEGNSKLKYGVFKQNEGNLFNELIEERVVSF